MIFDRTNIQCDGNQIKVIVSPAAGFDGARREIAQFKTEVNQRVDEVEDLVIGIGSGEGGKGYPTLADALAADIPDNVIFQVDPGDENEGVWRRDSSVPEGAVYLGKRFEPTKSNENLFSGELIGVSVTDAYTYQSLSSSESVFCKALAILLTIL